MDILKAGQRVARALDPKNTRRLPAHVVYRVAALLGEDEILFAEESLAGEGIVDHGEVVLITPSRVVRAVVSPGPDQLPEVIVETWSRKQLTGISLPPVAASDEAWDSPDGGHLPVGVQFVAHFGEYELALPLSPAGSGKEVTRLLGTFLIELSAQPRKGRSFMDQLKE